MNYTQQLAILEKYFKGVKKYEKILDQCMEYYKKGCFQDLEKEINKFPSEEMLFETLVNKLKGKSVYSNLKSLTENKTNLIDSGKAISSLVTHCLIECKDNPEYKMLLPILYEKLGNLIYEM